MNIKPPQITESVSELKSLLRKTPVGYQKQRLTDFSGDSPLPVSEWSSDNSQTSGRADRCSPKNDWTLAGDLCVRRT